MHLKCIQNSATSSLLTIVKKLLEFFIYQKQFTIFSQRKHFLN